MIVDEDGILEKSTYVADLLVNGFNIALKLLVDMHNESMGRMDVTTEVSTKWLDHPLSTVINTKSNGVVQQKHLLRSLDAKSTVHYTTLHLYLLVMVNIP